MLLNGMTWNPPAVLSGPLVGGIGVCFPYPVSCRRTILDRAQAERESALCALRALIPLWRTRRASPDRFDYREPDRPPLRESPRPRDVSSPFSSSSALCFCCADDPEGCCCAAGGGEDGDSRGTTRTGRPSEAVVAEVSCAARPTAPSEPVATGNPLRVKGMGPGP